MRDFISLFFSTSTSRSMLRPVLLAAVQCYKQFTSCAFYNAGTRSPVCYDTSDISTVRGASTISKIAIVAYFLLCFAQNYHRTVLASFPSKNQHWPVLLSFPPKNEHWPAGPSGIPGLNSNPDPGILENIIPGFLGIYHIKQNHDFKDF